LICHHMFIHTSTHDNSLTQKDATNGSIIECDPRGGMCEPGGGWDDKAMNGGDPDYATLVENLMVMVRDSLCR
jgi:hypothetical protein